MSLYCLTLPHPFQSPEGVVLTVQLLLVGGAGSGKSVSVPRRGSADGATLHLRLQVFASLVSVPRRGSADGATRVSFSDFVECKVSVPRRGSADGATDQHVDSSARCEVSVPRRGSADGATCRLELSENPI